MFEYLGKITVTKREYINLLKNTAVLEGLKEMLKSGGTVQIWEIKTFLGIEEDERL